MHFMIRDDVNMVRTNDFGDFVTDQIYCRRYYFLASFRRRGSWTDMWLVVVQFEDCSSLCPLLSFPSRHALLERIRALSKHHMDFLCNTRIEISAYKEVSPVGHVV